MRTRRSDKSSRPQTASARAAQRSSAHRVRRAGHGAQLTGLRRDKHRCHVATVAAEQTARGVGSTAANSGPARAGASLDSRGAASGAA